MWNIYLAKGFIYLNMLLRLDNASHENVKKLLDYARTNHIELSVVDDTAAGHSLPGKPLTPQELTQLIESSRKSGMISLTDAHQIVRAS
jgi:hypothetical protein